MLYHDEIILSLAFGAVLLWWWKSSEDEKLRIQELKHRHFIQNLAISQDFSKIISLSQDDYVLLLTFLSPSDAEIIRNKKIEYEEKIQREAEDRKAQALIERERLRIEELRKRRIRMIEMANNFDTDIIKHISNTDFNELTKYLSLDKIAVASAVRNTYQTEMRLKREADAMHAETARLRLERIRLEQERETDRQNDILRLRTHQIVADNKHEYQKGIDKGQIDGLKRKHAANNWDWFFTSSEYKQGYEIGYSRSKQEIDNQVNQALERVGENAHKIGVELTSTISRQEITNQINHAVEKIGEKIDESTRLFEEINKAKESQPIYDARYLVNPYNQEQEQEQEPESESEQEQEQEQESEQEQEQESEQEKQMRVLDMMMHN